MPQKSRPSSGNDGLQTALAHHRAGRLDRAESLYRQILQADPRHAGALHLSGVIAHQRGDLEAAAALISAAIEVKPAVAEYHGNLGLVFRKQNRLGAAIECYRRALSINPQYVEAHNNLGVALKWQGDWEAALECYGKALAIKPDCSDALANRGTILRERGRFEEAIAHFRQALAISPSCAAAQSELSLAHTEQGLAYAEQGQPAAAEACFRTAISIDPRCSAAYKGLGWVLLEHGRQEEALSVFEQGIATNPFAHELHTSSIFAAGRVYQIESAEVFVRCRRFGRQFETGAVHAVHANAAVPGKRLKIGYVSGDFYRHSVAGFIEPVLAGHDRDNVEVFCYYNNYQIDEASRRLMGYADHWSSLFGVADDQAERIIRQDGIDILVDLSGHTARNRLLLFARKPAPLQVTWIGYPSSTGLAAMDYRLTNVYVNPPGWHDAFYTETLVYLPVSTCFQPESPLPEVAPLPALKNGYTTFASFHAPNKINDETLLLWAKILSAVPSARLLFCPDNSREFLVQRFQALGIAAERLAFLAKRPLSQYMALYNEVDILLDTFPYNGSTVSRHALWMGVPVLTLAGRSGASRVGLALLTQLGLASFAAESEDELLERARRWAGDREGLARVRGGLRDKMSQAPFNQPAVLLQGLEAAYRQMWLGWCARQER